VSKGDDQHGWGLLTFAVGAVIVMIIFIIFASGR
jgi:hypothetical protein